MKLYRWVRIGGAWAQVGPLPDIELSPEMKKAMNNTTLDTSPLFTLEAAAEKLTISVRQLRRIIDSGQIPTTTIGVRGVRISQQMIDDYRAAHTERHAAAGK